MDNNNNIRAEFTTLLCNKVVLDETIYIYIFINVTPDILACHNTSHANRYRTVLHGSYVKVVDISYNSNQLIA